MNHEAAFVRSFVLPARRARLTRFLSHPKHRAKVLSSLDHFNDFDPRYMVDIAPAFQSAEGVAALLKERGAPSVCHVISSDRGLDGTDLPLAETLARVVGSGRGTVVSCVPGKLAYYEGETPGHRRLLARQDTTRLKSR